MTKKKAKSTRATSTTTANTQKPYKSATKKTEVKSFNSQVVSVITFAGAVLLLCLVLVRGENVWTFFHDLILGVFGNSAILWPILLFYISISTALKKPVQKISYRLWLGVALIFIFSTTLYVFAEFSQTSVEGYFNQLSTLYKDGIAKKGTGFLSGVLGIPLIKGFGLTGGKIFTLVLLFVCAMLLTGTDLIWLFKAFSKPYKAVKEGVQLGSNRPKRVSSFSSTQKIDIPLDEIPPDSYKEDPHLLKSYQDKEQSLSKLKRVCEGMTENGENVAELEDQPSAHKVHKKTFGGSFGATYQYPSPQLLVHSVASGDKSVKKLERSRAAELISLLASFNVPISVSGVMQGPSVTRYEVKPGSGIKISKITNLADDIALNFAASGVRIEAPIPGKAAVGIEIPNENIDVVRMRELVESYEFRGEKSKLTVILGRDITGTIKFADLEKMPHLLIAGSTGSGKSVCINSFLISLLYKTTPDEVRLLLIDPKVVELSVYNGIPHLLEPVVTDPEKAARILNGAVSKMNQRYRTFAENNVRDITSYNEMVEEKNADLEPGEEPLAPMHKIVIVIDELADLMMIAPSAVEDSICRLAQMARAAGIHLVIATQRPSVDVITGIIKANIPSRVALAVSSSIDSRTILDASGAEKLLGRGDMLFSPIGISKPVRIQGCYVTSAEVKNVVRFLKESQTKEYEGDKIEEVEVDLGKKANGPEDGEDDPMLGQAINCIMECGQASTSMLQRKLRLGYARAGRIMDQLEQKGIVGPAEGSKPRKILSARYNSSE